MSLALQQAIHFLQLQEPINPFFKAVLLMVMLLDSTPQVLP